MSRGTVSGNPYLKVVQAEGKKRLSSSRLTTTNTTTSSSTTTTTTTTTTTATTTVNPLTGIETKCFLGFSAWVQVFRVDGFGLRLRVNCFVLKV